MLTFDTTTIRANTVAFGNQSGPEVVALEGGGFVVAWTDQQLSTTNSRNVLFQRYDANGVAVGVNTMVAATNGSSEVLTDLVALPGGGFAVAWLSSGVANMQGYGISNLQQLPVVRVFSGTGTAVGSDVVLYTGSGASNTVHGLELVATSGGLRGLFTNSDPTSWTLRVADVSAAGALVSTSNLGTIANGGVAVVEAIAAPGFNGQLVLLSQNSNNRQATLLTTTAAPGSPISVPNAFDVIDLGTGLVTTVGTLPSPLLSGDTSVASEMYQYPALVAGLTVNDVVLLNVGDNVFLQAIAGNGVLSLRAVDAVTGAITDTATIETGPSAQDVELTRLVDGRIVVTWWRSDVFGAETFFRILATDGIPTFTGTGLGDSLTGSGAADVIAGLDGNDTITATAGADTIDGGAGIDTLLYTSAAGPVLVDLTTPANNGDVALGQVLTGIEVVLGTALNDRITGSAGADTLNGGAGNDQLNGGDGDDVLVLSAGADTMNGGAGNDTARLTGATSALVIDLPSPAIMPARRLGWS